MFGPVFKRTFDFYFALIGLVISSPILLPVMFLIWLQDRHSPLFLALRVGQSGTLFRMVKLRSMVINADKSGVDSTATNDARITRLGRFVRRFKLDELPQLWNVLVGDMSLVGPRPQVERDVAIYTNEERDMLSVKPGITDFASIVFADEGDILKGSADPDLRYNQLIRPWKSRLALFYIKNATVTLDFQLIGLTVLTLISRKRALNALTGLLLDLGADDKLVGVAGRKDDLAPYPPPGSSVVVQSREVFGSP